MGGSPARGAAPEPRPAASPASGPPPVPSARACAVAHRPCGCPAGPARHRHRPRRCPAAAPSSTAAATAARAPPRRPSARRRGHTSTWSAPGWRCPRPSRTASPAAARHRYCRWRSGCRAGVPRRRWPAHPGSRRCSCPGFPDRSSGCERLPTSPDLPVWPAGRSRWCAPRTWPAAYRQRCVPARRPNRSSGSRHRAK